MIKVEVTTFVSFLQEVFELVEQSLGLLAAQHHHHQQQQNSPTSSPNSSSSSSSGGGGGWVAVNHIRDQIIPPQERSRRKRAWDEAVRYIREQESRVREEVRRIYGEEHLVWRWVPGDLVLPHHQQWPFRPHLVAPPSPPGPAHLRGGGGSTPFFGVPPPPHLTPAAFNHHQLKPQTPATTPTTSRQQPPAAASPAAFSPPSPPPASSGAAWQVRERLVTVLRKNMSFFNRVFFFRALRSAL